MPAERSGQKTFDFQYGEDFGEHIERFDPDFTKVLVRYNPAGDAEENRVQLGKLKQLSDWLKSHDRKFLFELLVPAEPAQLESVGGDAARYVDPHSTNELVAAMRDFEDDAKSIQGLREKGLARAAGFSWELTARRTLDVYDKC